MIAWFVSLFVGIVGGYFSVRSNKVKWACYIFMILPAWVLIWQATYLFLGKDIGFMQLFGDRTSMLSQTSVYFNYAAIFCPVIFFTVRAIGLMREDFAPVEQAVSEDV